jgi:hypothetical protein
VVGAGNTAPVVRQSGVFARYKNDIQIDPSGKTWWDAVDPAAMRPSRFDRQTKSPRIPHSGKCGLAGDNNVVTY